MIQPLRRIHRRAFLALAVVLPTIFVAGLRGRHTWPVAPIDNPASSGLTLLIESDEGWHTLHIRQRVFTAADEDPARRLRLEPQQVILEPEVLVYWSSHSPEGISLPEAARLLGKFDPAGIYLLPGSVDEGGFLLLFSNARQSVLDWAPVGGRS